MFSRTGAPAYKPGLDTSLALAAYFDNPHTKFKSIHIGGTNGKGSTSHMLASILQSQGYKVGLYTSPHLVDFRERIRINGKMIAENKVVEFVEKWKTSDFKGHPSFFELTMIMAFAWFAEEKVDYAVVEVGMGGRLDSTNIITPVLSVITNISYDHTQFLGDTLEKIAHEKAGIIKPGIPAVIGEMQKDTDNVFIKKAEEISSPLIFATKCDNLPELSGAAHGWNIKYKGRMMTLPLGGEYQKKNIVTVLAAIEELKKLKITISDKALKNGIENVLRNTGFAGRWSVIEENPLTILDTGHNKAGLTYNFNQLQHLIKNRPGGNLRIIIGFVADKDVDGIMKLMPTDAIYYLTNALIPRAMPVKQLLQKFNIHGFNGQTFANVSEAYERAKEEASAQDIIFIGGSTFIVADLLSYLEV